DIYAYAQHSLVHSLMLEASTLLAGEPVTLSTMDCGQGMAERIVCQGLTQGEMLPLLRLYSLPEGAEPVGVSPTFPVEGISTYGGDWDIDSMLEWVCTQLGVCVGTDGLYFGGQGQVPSLRPIVDRYLALFSDGQSEVGLTSEGIVQHALELIGDAVETCTQADQAACREYIYVMDRLMAHGPEWLEGERERVLGLLAGALGADNRVRMRHRVAALDVFIEAQARRQEGVVEVSDDMMLDL
ncbi:hypothetical protein KIPB_002340, partial [Kipferlia bialata]